MERDDPRVRQLVAAVARTVGERLPTVTRDVQGVIEDAIPWLRADESAGLLHASIGGNLDAAVRILIDAAELPSVEAPAAAGDYARRLAAVLRPPD